MRSLRQQALIGFAVAALLPAFLLAAVGTVAVRGLSALARTSARTALEQQVTQGLVIRVSEKAREGDSLFRGVLSQAITLSQYASWQAAGMAIPNPSAADLAFADPLLASIQQSTPGAYRAWLRTPALSYRAFPDQAAGRSAVVAGKRSGLPPALTVTQTFPTWTQPYPDPDSGRLIMTATATAPGPDRQPWAVAGVDMLLSNLFAAVMRPAADGTQYDFLLDQEGLIVNLSEAGRIDLDLPAATAPGLALKDSARASVHQLEQTLRRAGGPGLTTVQTAGGLRYVAYAPMPVSGWVLGEVVSEAALTGQATGVEQAIQRREALFLGGGAIGGCVLIPLLILLAVRRSKNLSRPVSQLVEGSRRLAQDLSYRVSTDLPTELAVLAHALNNMAASLERSRDEAVRGARLVAEERNRLAREIHDTIAQGLTAVVVQLQTAEDILGDGAPPDAMARLARARQVARESLAEARRSVWNLRPGATAGGGLVHALTALKPGMEADGIDCVLELHPVHLDEAAEDALFRVAQEALANVRKHSGAKQVTLSLDQAAGWVRLRIVDDGVGFDPAALTGPQPAAGFGLWAIRTRLAQVGGTVSIESRPGAGTAVTAEIPAGGEDHDAGDQGAGGR
jgi:signal transduction histidine kinase